MGIKQGSAFIKCMNRLQFSHFLVGESPVEAQVSMGIGPRRTCGFGFIYIYLHCFIPDYVSFKRVLKAFGIKIVNCIFLLTPVVSWFCLGFVAHMWQCFGVAGGHKHLEIHPQIKKKPNYLKLPMDLP